MYQGGFFFRARTMLFALTWKNSNHRIFYSTNHREMIIRPQKSISSGKTLRKSNQSIQSKMPQVHSNHPLNLKWWSLGRWRFFRHLRVRRRRRVRTWTDQHLKFALLSLILDGSVFEYRRRPIIYRQKFHPATTCTYSWKQINTFDCSHHFFSG